MIPTDIADRLTALGRHLDDERGARSLLRVIDGPPAPTGSPGAAEDLQPVRTRGRGRVLAAVAGVLAVVATGLAVLTRSDGPSVEATSPAPGDAVSAQAASGAPAPGSIVPFVDQPPAWFGRPLAGMREGPDRTGRWVTATAGIQLGDAVVSPVTISVTDGTAQFLDGAETIEIDGRPVRSVKAGRWQALATTGNPYVVVSGTIGEAALADLLTQVEVVSEVGGSSLRIDDLPDRYVLVQSPLVLGDVPPQRPTFASDRADVSINESSEWVEAELAAAGSGETYHRVDVGGRTGWAGQTDLPEFGPLSFLTWSPEPGVVLEITTSNPDRTIEDLIDLAIATRTVPVDTWTELMQGQ